MVTKQKKRFVAILSALPGDKKYTSLKRALELIEAGRADPTGLNQITLRPAVVASAAQQQQAKRDRENVAVTAARNGVFWWNGCDTRRGAAHLPFTATVFLPPDAIVRGRQTPE